MVRAKSIRLSTRSLEYLLPLSEKKPTKGREGAAAPLAGYLKQSILHLVIAGVKEPFPLPPFSRNQRSCHIKDTG
jgi:hypothetical protein